MPCEYEAPNLYLIILHDDTNFNAHIREVQRVISVENFRVARGESETNLTSFANFDFFVEAGLLQYYGTFSRPVLRWIRARPDVQGVHLDVNFSRRA